MATQLVTALRQQAAREPRRVVSDFFLIARDLYARFLKNNSRQDETAILISLLATINSSTSGAQATDEYTVPSESVLYIEQIIGIVAFNALTSETLSITGVGNPDFVQRLQIKASNCRVKLQDLDGSRDFTSDGDEVPLSAFIPQAGGRAVIFPEGRPEMVPPGHKLKLTARLQDTTAAILGAETVYGLVLIGKLIREPSLLAE